MPDSAISPTMSASISIATPRSGSATTRTSGTRQQPIVSATARSRGRVSPCRISPRMMAATRMIDSLAYSDGSIWKPPGSEIHDLAPFTTLPSGVSTASSPRQDRPSTNGEYSRSCR